MTDSILYITLWFSVSVPTLVGTVWYHRLPKSLQAIVYLMFAGLLAEIGFRVLADKNNVFIIQIYTIAEIILLTYFFSLIITSKKARSIIQGVGLMCLVLALIEIIVIGNLEYNSVSITIESIAMITFSFFYFYEAAMAVTPSPIRRDATFWVAAVIALYFMGSLQYFLLVRYLFNSSPKSISSLWMCHNILNAFCNLAYAAILWKFRFTRSYSLPPSSFRH